MSNKFLMFNLDDDKAKSLGEVISNPTSKKIVNLLAENEASESDIAKALKIPANTVNYNVKRLVDAGLIESTKRFFWSSKGRKVLSYKVANKLIVISPKRSSNVYNKLKSIVPVVLISGILTVFVSWYYKSVFLANRTLSYVDKTIVEENLKSGATAIMEAAPNTSDIITTVPTVPEAWVWFGLGSLVTVLIYSMWNWKRI